MREAEISKYMKNEIPLFFKNKDLGGPAEHRFGSSAFVFTPGVLAAIKGKVKLADVEDANIGEIQLQDG